MAAASIPFRARAFDGAPADTPENLLSTRFL
jgi:hypothetical protein